MKFTNIQELYDVIAANVRKFRKQKGWSQTQLSDVADISYVAVSNLEGGDIGTVRVLWRVAQAFGVTIEDLFRPCEIPDSKRVRGRPPGMLNRDKRAMNPKTIFRSGDHGTD